MFTEELFASARPEPPEVVAFRMVREAEWVDFMLDVTNGFSKTRFFNPELKEFSSAETWEALSEEYGIAPYSDELAIPDALPANAKAFCRQLRMDMRAAGEENCGGSKAFYTPREWDKLSGERVTLYVVMVVCYNGGNMAARFNLDYEAYKLYDSVDVTLRSHGLWREDQNSTVTHIFNIE